MTADWKLIDHAPRDRVILLCVAGCQPAIGRWINFASLKHTGHWIASKRDGQWISFDPEGQFEDDDELMQYLASSRYSPSHWDELPEPAI